jgi:hypothetical protein
VEAPSQLLAGWDRLAMFHFFPLILHLSRPINDSRLSTRNSEKRGKLAAVILQKTIKAWRLLREIYEFDAAMNSAEQTANATVDKESKCLGRISCRASHTINECTCNIVSNYKNIDRDSRSTLAIITKREAEEFCSDDFA